MASPIGLEIAHVKPEVGKPPKPPENNHRAVHQIRLSAISHNYTCVESAATRQRCSVIVVVKADGYGHGAIQTALHLADHMGADAFAVATLEEGIALRKAFESTLPSSYSPHPPNNSAIGELQSNDSPESRNPPRSMRPPQIRILVLGPPVGFPRCFDDYYHHQIEVMCSGPEVAKALMEWISDEKERKRTQVERAANDAKAAALLARPAARDAAVQQQQVPRTILSPVKNGENGKHHEKAKNGKAADNLPPLDSVLNAPAFKESAAPNATLGNVSGQDLAKEVRAYLVAQQAAKDAAKDKQMAAQQQHLSNGISSDSSTVVTSATVTTNTDIFRTNPQSISSSSSAAPVKGQVFGGIEAVAKSSRTREMAAARAQIFREDSTASDDTVPTSSVSTAPTASITTASTATITTTATASRATNLLTRKRLRYHVLVDSGMGRLGFKTQPVEVSDVGVRRDTVEIIQELMDMEVQGAPIEFFGMCTHMADANSTSTYTNDQMNRFKGLLKRVRAAEISIPTVSTDNSAALLTTNLKHFDAKALLSQPHAETRGFVRTGGAIYGQRPAFKQLRAVSTLLASVRHVAVLRKGESVGYDRAYIALTSVRIATLTIGFADGYPRELGNGVGKVAIRGHLFPVAGNVCMDMMMVALGPAGDKECPGADVVVGDTAVLWGPLDENDGDGLVRLQDIAGTLKTTQSALTCGLDNVRVERQYI